MCKIQSNGHVRITANFCTQYDNNLAFRLFQKAFVDKHSSLTGKRPFHCEICAKAFARKADFNKYLRSHSNEKDFKCDKCEKAYKYRNNLISHLHIHEGTNFVCNVC